MAKPCGGRKWGERKVGSPVIALTLEAVSSLLPDSADEAPQAGNFLVEFVEPDPDELGEITELLRWSSVTMAARSPSS